jgi:hypothetical protein
MPMTKKGREIMAAMKQQYGEEKGEKVFYASRNKGTITGVDKGQSFTVKDGKMKKGTKVPTEKEEEEED